MCESCSSGARSEPDVKGALCKVGSPFLDPFFKDFCNAKGRFLKGDSNLRP